MPNVKSPFQSTAVECWQQKCTQDCAASFSFAFKVWLYLQILQSWDPPAQPRKKLTQNRFQFFGIMTSEYLDQIRPVAVSTADWEVLSFSAGRVISAKPAPTRPHLNIGAQKKTVLGPAGWLYKGLSLAGSICSILSKILWQDALNAAMTVDVPMEMQTLSGT